jgi:exonuclease III
MLFVKIFCACCCVSSVFSVSEEQAPPYIYRQGEAVEKNNPRNRFTVLTLNTCMMDGELPTRYGGMIPFVEHTNGELRRVDRVARYILNKNPDIFCGQEVMLNSGEELYQKLRDRYTHFWVGIGNEPGQKQSGLFVASKLPFQGVPQFVPFLVEEQIAPEFLPPEGRLIYRGFFYIDMGEFYIVTTHLEAGNDRNGGTACRIHQLDLITAHMDRLGKPYMLLGDLNIERTGQENDEYSRSRIASDYYDQYTIQNPGFDETTFTCTNLFTAAAAGKEIPMNPSLVNEIDDYVLIRKGGELFFRDLKIQLHGDTYRVDRPREEAITDHKAYEASFEFIR